MKKTSADLFIESVVEYNKTHSKEEVITNAMNLVMNIVLASTDSHIEEMGMIECIKLELQESFIRESGDDSTSLMRRIILNKNLAEN